MTPLDIINEQNHQSFLPPEESNVHSRRCRADCSRARRRSARTATEQTEEQTEAAENCDGYQCLQSCIHGEPFAGAMLGEEDVWHKAGIPAVGCLVSVDEGTTIFAHSGSVLIQMDC